MAAYHVFIERPRDAGTGAPARLAAAVADRYGIPATTLIERLAAGRLRVKSNVDLETAETFAADLETLGAVCSIVDAATDQAVTKVAAPKPAPPAPPAPVERPRAANAAPFQSGLSAAFGAAAAPPAQDLGVLGGDSGQFSLATLDGDDDQAPTSSGSFGPPAAADAAALPASMGPAIAMTQDAPMDAFAPPDAEAELALVLDTEPIRDRRGGTTNTAPPATVDPTMAADPAAAAPPPARGPGVAGWIADARVRLAGGVLVAILLGFVPASILASVRERSAFAEIDRELQQTFERAEHGDARDLARLDGARAFALTHKRDARKDIALGSIVVWALVGGAVAFGWFRKLDWDAIVARVAR